MNFNFGLEKLTLKKVMQLAEGTRAGILLPEVIARIQKSNEIVQVEAKFLALKLNGNLNF